MDETESIRRNMVQEINAQPGLRKELEAQYGQVYDTTELGQVYDTTELGQGFEVLGFMAPFVVVRRKSDGIVGTLMFQSSPRYYFDFKEDRP